MNVAKEQKSVNEHIHEQMGNAYIGFQELYDVLKPYENANQGLKQKTYYI